MAMRKMIKIIHPKKQMCNSVLLSLHILLCVCIVQIECDIYSSQNRHYECSRGKNYTTGSELDRNLQAALGNLTDVGDKGGQKHVQVGESPNKVYAMANCRGDASPSQCGSCVEYASDHITAICGTSPGGRFWNEDCYLRWEKGADFIGKLDVQSGAYFLNTANASNRNAFDKKLMDLLANLSKEAVNNPNRYASGSAVDLSFHKISAFVQCWKDISVEDCESCLSFTLDVISSYSYSLGGTSFTGSCVARYETYSFIENSALPPPPRSVTHASSPLSAATSSSSDKSKNNLLVIMGSTVASLVLVLTVLSCWYVWRSKRRRLKNYDNGPDEEERLENGEHLIIFNKSTLMAATSNFEEDCKLGEGGFGVVYKGVLQDGKEIAIKKLSLRSSQGKIEFMNEIRIVVKIQHRNLVSLVNLIGCCMEDSERMLVYEFMTNGSLDGFLFNSEKKKMLGWEKRINIIYDVIRGLLYLHEESQLKIIHRDIKASNILLDDNFNAKLADFGLAKLFPEGQSRIQTAVAGTYGYMAPEYVMHGQLSSKADIYSFGVVVLEILSGKRNSRDDTQSLLEWIWKQYKEGKCIEIIDGNVKEKCNYEEAIRFIHVALLCTQVNPTLRPSISEIAMMLSSASINLPNPTAPAFLNLSDIGEFENTNQAPTSQGNTLSHMISASQSITIIQPR